MLHVYCGEPYEAYADLKQWVREHEGKTLREMQLDAAKRGLQWIRATKGLKFPHQRIEETEPLRQQGEKDVEAMIERLEAGETIARKRSFVDTYGEDFR